MIRHDADMWWPWFDQEALTDPVLRAEGELLTSVLVAACASPERRMSYAEIDKALGLDVAPRLVAEDSPVRTLSARRGWVFPHQDPAILGRAG
jgi:hypothetical protein